MSATSPIDLTSSPVPRIVTSDEVVIISDDEPSSICNYTTIGVDNQNNLHSPTTSRHSNNNQASTISNVNYNLRNGLTGLGTHGTHSSNGGGGPIRNTSTRSRTHSRPPSTLRVSAQSNNNGLRHRQHHYNSAFHRYASSIPTTTEGHTRDLEESHILICAGCNDLLHEKLWALNGCGHVVCGSCVDKFSGKKKIACPSCKKKPTSTLQLYV
ncbi:11201_t:CDS:2 [Funneliformis geosporum]|uniref:3602_t:CDS:1 n=1 Tax=Funneliformis geosporum TaxID=1117311 RepID=A0A9W4SHJ8_9GLOM|nr:11201_t:CDS:2 [Funneliformis geosporum]CAI2169707.1 3602_t:CDS:2 [Funneliformis geosporum]